MTTGVRLDESVLTHKLVTASMDPILLPTATAM